MATLDDILNPDNKTAVKKQFNSVNTTTQQSEQQQNNNTKKPPETYTELLEKLNPKPDKDKLKKDAKRARTRNIIAALGDGLTALSNLYFTSKGAPNMYDGKNTLSEKSQARYDKLIQDYKDNLEKYKQGYLKGYQLDKEWNYRDAKDRQTQANWQTSFEHTKDRDQKNDEFRNKQATQAQENWQKTYDANQANNKATRALQEKRIESYNTRYNAQKRGKKLGFSDGGEGNNVNIYENVWKVSYPVVFKQLVDEGIGRNDNMSELTYSMKMNTYTPNEKMEFVAQNWHKSNIAKNMMMELSKIDPAVDDSEIDIDSYISSYDDSSSDDNDYTFTFGNDNDNDLDW